MHAIIYFVSREKLVRHILTDTIENNKFGLLNYSLVSCCKRTPIGTRFENEIVTYMARMSSQQHSSSCNHLQKQFQVM